MARRNLRRSKWGRKKEAEPLVMSDRERRIYEEMDAAWPTDEVWRTMSPAEHEALVVERRVIPEAD